MNNKYLLNEYKITIPSLHKQIHAYTNIEKWGLSNRKQPMLKVLKITPVDKGEYGFKKQVPKIICL